MSLTRATTLFAVLLVVGAFRPARADDSSPPPESFTVPVQSNDGALAPGADDIDTSDQSGEDVPRHRRHEKKRSGARAVDQSSDDAVSDGGTATPLSVVDEPDQVPTDVTPSDLSSQRAGVPLVNDGKGLELVQPIQPNAQGSFTFRASAAQAKPHRARLPSAAPESLVAPSSGTPSPEPPSNDADQSDDDDNVVQGSTADSLLNLTGTSQQAPSAPAAPSTFVPPSPAPSGSGTAIPIVQVPLQYHDETEIVVGGSPRHHRAKPSPPAAQPPASDATAPTPPTEPMTSSPLPADGTSSPNGFSSPTSAPSEPESSAPAPNTPARSQPATPSPSPVDEPDRSTHSAVVPTPSSGAPAETPSSAARAPAPVRSDALDELPSPTSGPAAPASSPRASVPSPAAASPAAGSAAKLEDPFQKLDRDMRALEKTQPLPPDQSAPEPPAEIHPRVFHTSPFAETPVAVPPTPVPHRPALLLGLSVLAGVGPAIMDDSTTGYATRLAYGLTASFNPAIAGPFAIDLSAFRATATGGTPFVSVDSAWNNFAIRLLYLKWQPYQVFVGFGAGLLLTENSATYRVDDGEPTQATGAVLRPGVDATSVVGMQLGLVQLRVDLRVLLRGGFRLDFLPTFSAGVGF